MECLNLDGSFAEMLCKCDHKFIVDATTEENLIHKEGEGLIAKCPKCKLLDTEFQTQEAAETEVKELRRRLNHAKGQLAKRQEQVRKAEKRIKGVSKEYKKIRETVSDLYDLVRNFNPVNQPNNGTGG